MGLQQCKTDPCVWKLVKETSWRPQLQVLALFHIDGFMLVGSSNGECVLNGSCPSGNKDICA